VLRHAEKALHLSGYTWPAGGPPARPCCIAGARSHKSSYDCSSRTLHDINDRVCTAIWVRLLCFLRLAAARRGVARRRRRLLWLQVLARRPLMVLLLRVIGGCRGCRVLALRWSCLG
jgi:hypothetical protein